MRILNGQTVLINDYSKEPLYQQRLTLVLRDTLLNVITLPYNPYANTSTDQANGIYINYLEVRQAVLIPSYGLPEDEPALRLFERLFSPKPVYALDRTAIANEGGVLNCISWTVV